MTYFHFVLQAAPVSFPPVTSTVTSTVTYYAQSDPEPTLLLLASVAIVVVVVLAKILSDMHKAAA